MEALIKYFANEGRVILQAPAIFAIAIVLVGGIIWAALGWKYSSQIANLQSRISLRDDQIGDYKDKLSGATPDEAKKRLDALELQVKALSPRRLTNEQKAQIAHTVGGKTALISIARDAAVGDTAPYTADLAQAFQDGGWHVQTPMVFGIGRPPATGVGLLAVDPHALSLAEATIKRALEAVKIDFDVQEGGPPPALAGEPANVRLIITARAK